MAKATIRISYRILIDSTAKTDFDKLILKLSYDEFLLKSQVYNAGGKLKTFAAMAAIDGRANSLHYKTGFAIAGLVEKLDKRIPALKDESGKSLLFENYRFEVVESDISNISLHKVAIHFTTAALVLHESLGNFLILAESATDQGEPSETFTLQLQPNLSVSSYQVWEIP